MKFSSQILVFTGIILSPISLMAQVNYSVPNHYVQPIQQLPVQNVVYRPSPARIAQPQSNDPFDACKCNTPTGDCNCKNLDCKIRLPYCKTSRPPRKDPIHCEIIGKIPKVTIRKNCQRKITNFAYPTEVPEVHCITEECVEIGKKQIQCLPGCSFSVCIPINECTTETVECKLVNRKMKMELWERKDPNHGTVYDVYVINDPDPKSPFHAGGMPLKWLILHCASVSQVKSRFPNSVRADGKPLVKSAKDAKPMATDADVPLDLDINRKIAEEYVKRAQAKVDKNSKSKIDNTVRSKQGGGNKSVARAG